MDFVNIFKDATGLPTADTVFEKSQKMPYIIFLDKQGTDGDDFNVQIIEHNLTVELYSEKIDRQHEKMLEALFDQNAWKWTRDRQWLPDQRCFFTVYGIEKFFEKYRKENEQ